MNTVFILHTRGDPLTAIRHFLRDLWGRTDVDGMLIPIIRKEDTSVTLCLSDHPEQMAEADPFAPAISYNTAQFSRSSSRNADGARIRKAGRS
jgi:hypothetical protein